jgi:hypothetical protein
LRDDQLESIPSIVRRAERPEPFRDPQEEVCATKVDHPREGIEIPRAQRDHGGAVTTFRADVVNEGGDTSRLRVARRRQAIEFDDDTRAVRFDRSNRVGEKPVRREPIQTRQFAEADEGKGSFRSLVAAERGRLESSPRTPSNVVEGEVSLQPSAPQLPPHRSL